MTRLAIAGLGLVLIAVADHLGWLLVPRGGDIVHYHGAEARVLRVLGSTRNTVDLEIDIEDVHDGRATTRVRIWGIAAAPGAADLTVRRTRALIDAEPITLWLEPTRTRAAYGELVAHVDLATGASLAEALLAEGLATSDERLPHRWLAAHANAERGARRRKRGVWSDQ